MIILRKNRLTALIFLLILIISLYYSDIFTIDNIKNNKIFIKEFITHNYIFSVFLFFISCIVFVNSPVPFAALLKVMGGFFFGFQLGAVYNIIATIFACLTGFLLSRYAFKDDFEKIYYQRLKKVESEIETNGFYYFLTLRLVMVVPYFLINIIAGLSRISATKFLLSTILGVIPASLIYANGGNKLEQINSISELFRIDIAASLFVIALISLVPTLIKK